MLPLIPSLVLAPTFIVLMVSIHYYAAQEKRIWSQLGMAFAVVYAVMASLNYIMQLTVVRFSILNKETDGLPCIRQALVYHKCGGGRLCSSPFS